MNAWTWACRAFIAAAVAFALYALYTASPADAQGAVPCGDRAKVVALLAKRYKEVPRAMGLASRSGILEIYVSEKGSWTILMTSTKGRSCMLAVGENWEDLKAISLDPKI